MESFPRGSKPHLKAKLYKKGTSSAGRSSLKEGHFIQSMESLPWRAGAPTPSSGRPFPGFSLPGSRACVVCFLCNTWAGGTRSSAVGCSGLLVIFSVAKHFQEAEIVKYCSLSRTHELQNYFSLLDLICMLMWHHYFHLKRAFRNYR